MPPKPCGIARWLPVKPIGHFLHVSKGPRSLATEKDGFAFSKKKDTGRLGDDGAASGRPGILFLSSMFMQAINCRGSGTRPSHLVSSP